MEDQFEGINSTAGGSDVPRLPHNGLYLNPSQSRDHKPSGYENELADAIEAAYGDGIHELDQIISYLNGSGSRDPDGNEWTDDSFVRAMEILAK